MTPTVSVTIINLVTPNVRAKHWLLHKRLLEQTLCLARALSVTKFIKCRDILIVQLNSDIYSWKYVQKTGLGCLLTSKSDTSCLSVINFTSQLHVQVSPVLVRIRCSAKAGKLSYLLKNMGFKMLHPHNRLLSVSSTNKPSDTGT